MDQYDKMNAVEIAFRAIFHDAIYIETKRVKQGGTSNNIYVPKKFANNPVTIIIWEKEDDLDGRKESGNQGAELQASCEEEPQG